MWHRVSQHIYSLLEETSPESPKRKTQSSGKSVTPSATSFVTRQNVLEELHVPDDPLVFFNEMHVVLNDHSVAMRGLDPSKEAKSSTRPRRMTRMRQNEEAFEKFLLERWKELKKLLKDVQLSQCHELDFFLPLLDFDGFLRGVSAMLKEMETNRLLSP